MNTEHLKKFGNPYRMLDYEMNQYDGAHTRTTVKAQFIKHVRTLCKKLGFKLIKDCIILDSSNQVILWVYIKKELDVYTITLSGRYERERQFTEVELIKLIQDEEAYKETCSII